MTEYVTINQHKGCRFTVKLKHYIRSFVADPLQILDGKTKQCSLCAYHGRFWSYGQPSRRGSRCPQCLSLERHRLYGLLLAERPDTIKGKSVLHFAPETQITGLIQKYQPLTYVTADIEPGLAQRQEDMTQLKIGENEYDIAIANHVLEHIPADAKAFSEIHRILRPGGQFLVSVPIIEGWETTYENDNIKTAHDRSLHFGRYNHVRYYGRDFVTRFEKAGFDVERYQASADQCIKSGISYGETIFIGKKKLA